MSQDRPKALMAEQIEPANGAIPAPYDALRKRHVKRRPGDTFGLDSLGGNLVTVLPDGKSTLRHWHTQKDEFNDVVSGALMRVNDAGETALVAGMCAGFAAGTRDAHNLVNRSASDAQYLEMSSRIAAAFAVCPDDDLKLVRDAEGVNILYKDGRPYA